MTRYTLNIRTLRLAELIRKVVVVLPSPLMVLINAVLVYRKGQIQASVRINFPADLLWKIRLPRRFPVSRKQRQQNRPRIKQLPAAFPAMRRTSVRVPVERAAVTAGVSMVPTELVTADGKRMQGRAMPVSTPYVLSASEELQPNNLREAGMDAASML